MLPVRDHAYRERFVPVPLTVEVAEGNGPAKRRDIDGERVGQLYPPLQSRTMGNQYVNAATSVILSDHPTDNVGAPTVFRVVYRQLCIPTGVLQRIKSNRTGSLLRPP